MADDLAAALGVLTFMGILVSYNFINQMITDITASFGNPTSLPSGLSALVLIAAAGFGILIYMRTERR